MTNYPELVTALTPFGIVPERFETEEGSCDLYVYAVLGERDVARAVYCAGGDGPLVSLNVMHPAVMPAFTFEQQDSPMALTVTGPGGRRQFPAAHVGFGQAAWLAGGWRDLRRVPVELAAQMLRAVRSEEGWALVGEVARRGEEVLVRGEPHDLAQLRALLAPTEQEEADAFMREFVARNEVPGENPREPEEA